MDDTDEVKLQMTLISNLYFDLGLRGEVHIIREVLQVLFRHHWDLLGRSKTVEGRARLADVQ